jgi:hypothetical protein
MGNDRDGDLGVEGDGEYSVWPFLIRLIMFPRNGDLYLS